MCNVMWQVLLKDGTCIQEYDTNNKETLYTDILHKRKEFMILSLIDNVMNLSYSVNLLTGEIILNGLPIDLGKQIYGRILKWTNNSKYNNYSPIQYKVSKPVNVSSFDTKVLPQSYNIGYNLSIGEIIPDNKYEIIVKSVCVLINIDSETHKPCVSIEYTIEQMDKDTKEKRELKI